MTIMVGGEATAFAAYRPLLASMGRNIFHVGDIGAGCVAKLVTQYLGYTNLVTSLEGFVIAAKAGVDNIPRSVLSGTFTAGGTLDIVAKDVHLACELAREVGAPAHTGLIADDPYQRAQAQGWGQIGFPVVARILEAMAGVELRAAVSAEEARYEDPDPRRT